MNTERRINSLEATVETLESMAPTVDQETEKRLRTFPDWLIELSVIVLGETIALRSFRDGTWGRDWPAGTCDAVRLILAAPSRQESARGLLRQLFRGRIEADQFQERLLKIGGPDGKTN